MLTFSSGLLRKAAVVSRVLLLLAALLGLAKAGRIAHEDVQVVHAEEGDTAFGRRRVC